MTAPGDAYERHTASEAYRAERVRKAEVILALCGERLVRARRIADLGTGTGIIKNTLELTLGKPITGFEIDLPFVVERTGVVAADVTRLPAPDGAFDFVILNHVYEHVEDQSALFHEVFRVLDGGGEAYVSAGNKLAVIEPHYRLPFLGWLPRRAADAYLRASGRGDAYEGIWFRTRSSLIRLMRAPGFEVEDLTERALSELLGPDRGGAWRPAWAALRALPAGARAALLRAGSPQWFFLLRKAREAGR